MRKSFPQSNKAYVQNNRSNVFPMGNLWSTFGMDFQSNLGVARVAPRMRVNSSVDLGLDNLGVPTAFKFYSGAFRTVAGARCFNGGATPNAAFTQDAASGTPTDCSSDTSDLEVFEGKLWVSTNDELLRNGSGGTYSTWTTVSALNSGVPHIIRYFPLRNRLYISNGTTIISVDTSNNVSSTGDFTISLPFGNLIMSMDATADSIWIGTQSVDVDDMNGNIFQWDGLSAQADNVFPVNAKAVLAISTNEKSGLPVAMDSNGIFSQWNGSGFGEIGRLPYTNQLPYNPDGLVANKFIHFNGLAYTKNDTFLALINNLNNDNAGTINENLPSGVWEWSAQTNFVHKNPLTYNIAGSANVTDFGQNRVSRVGAIANADKPSTASGRFGTILAGAAIYTSATATNNAIFVDDSLNQVQKRGYMVMDWVESDQVADAWDVWWMTYRKFLQSTDNITVKYRSVESAPVEATITWVNGNTFTVLNSAVDISQYWVSGETGGEVEITRGIAGGACAHIINAVNNAGTWTVTLDESINYGLGTTTASARFQNWIKIFSAEPVETPRNWAQFAIGGDSQPRIEIKICFTFTGDGEYYKGILTSNEDIKATK